MPTQRVYLMPVLCTIILFSCNSKKQNNTEADNNNLAVTVSDTVSVTPDEPINVAQYNNRFEQNITQHFTAQPGKVSMITAAKGLKVTVNPGALEKEDGSAVDGKITVSIIELTTSDELFKSNAATVSDGQLLASGGSYFIGMECNGEKLRIKKAMTVPMEIPQLKKEEMKLFYGERSGEGNMNWIEANRSLEFDTRNNYTAFNPPFPDTGNIKSYNRYHYYSSLTEKVFFGGKSTTIRDMVATLQKKGIDKNIDTVYVNPYNFNQLFPENYVGCWKSQNVKMYRIISCKDLEREKDSLAKLKVERAIRHKANENYRLQWEKENQENSFTGQLQKYYAPIGITQLGWINCDRFYKSPERENIPLELPYTFTKGNLQYFIIYRSFNGLMSGKLDFDNQKTISLDKLPKGESATLVAFTKIDGQLYHFKEDFVVDKNKPVKLDFKSISAEEMSKMFGKNVRI